MAFSATLTSAQTLPSGRVLLRFGDNEFEFENLAALQQFARDALTPDVMRAVAIALMLTRQPNFNNPAAFVGHSVNIDFALNNWGTIT